MPNWLAYKSLKMHQVRMNRNVGGSFLYMCGEKFRCRSTHAGRGTCPELAGLMSPLLSSPALLLGPNRMSRVNPISEASVDVDVVDRPVREARWVIGCCACRAWMAYLESALINGTYVLQISRAVPGGRIAMRLGVCWAQP